MTTEKRILNSAASVFSHKGYKNTSIKEIAQKAEVNSLTVFRYFHDKETLFLSAVDSMKKGVFDPEALDERLTFRDLEADLVTMGKAYLDEIYASLPLIRIYIGDGLNFDRLREERWFVSPVLTGHFRSYISRLEGASPLAKEHAGLLAEMYVAYITRKVMSGSKYRSSWEKTSEFELSFDEAMAPQVRFMAHMISGQEGSGRRV